MIFQDPTLKNAPPKWAEVDKALGSFVPPDLLGFPCNPGALNYFRSRYRMAKSFQGMTLETYQPETVEGYSALMKTFLSYSAFEAYLGCVGIELKDTLPLAAPYDPAGCEAAVRAIQMHDSFLKGVLKHLDSKTFIAQYEFFLNSKPSNVIYLPGGIRHIFAHGILTPNTGAGWTAPTIQVCRELDRFLFSIMDGDFIARLKATGYIQ